MREPAVALLSGGMDSAVAAAWARDRGYDLVALTVDYGQKARAEIAAARAVGLWLGVREHLVLTADLRPVGGSALTGAGALARVPSPGGVPATYVPARNTILLALALGLAEARDARAVVIGANRIDYSGYPDCRPEFIEAFQAVADAGTRAGVEGGAPRILAPLLDHAKAEIVALGRRLGVPFERTLSCYEPGPDGRACGCCDSCRLRERGFAEAGLDDPGRRS